MRKGRLRIGRIPYANLFPFFYYLENQCDSSFYRFINGHPSRLNRMLRKGLIDISPSSSIEYLKHRDIYSILPFLSISSNGRIESILLFSKYPLEDLDNKTIALSSDSDTSVVMLKIILKEFEGLRCEFKTVNCRSITTPLTTASAVLLIGDTAMKEARKIKARPSLYIYDLGELWYRYTGLPFVFALWIIRNESLDKRKGLVKRLSLDLYNAREYTSRHLNLLADSAPQRQWLSKRELIEYWKNISYELTERHLEGLRLFEEHAIKNDLI